MPAIFRRAAALVACCLLAACGSELSSRGEVLRLLGSGLEPAYLGEEYSTTLQVVGGLTPYTFEVSEGALPPGLTLQGATLRGVPEVEGRYAFTVTVSDANLSKTFQEFTLEVTVPPPASLSLNVPDTEIQRAVTLRGTVSDARGLQGLRTRITWDPELFALLPESVRAASERYALFYQDAPGQLELDLAVLGGTVSGERRLFEFTLQPLQTTTLELAFDTEYAGERGHAYGSKREGVPSPLSQPSLAPQPPEAPPDGEDGGSSGIDDGSDTNDGSDGGDAGAGGTP